MAGKKGTSGIHDSNRTQKRTPQAIKLDRAETVKLLRRGWTQTAIAEKLGVHQTQISYDWKMILKEVNEARDKDLEELITVKLEEYGEIKREAWAAWERSKKERNKTVLETSTSSGKGRSSGDESDDDDNGGSERSREIFTRETGTWSSEYLKTILTCLAAERELLGLNPAKKFEGKMVATATTVDFEKLAKAIPPDGIPLPDDVENKIMNLLESVGANETIRPVSEENNRPSPKQIDHVPVSQSSTK